MALRPCLQESLIGQFAHGYKYCSNLVASILRLILFLDMITIDVEVDCHIVQEKVDRAW